MTLIDRERRRSGLSASAELIVLTYFAAVMSLNFCLLEDKTLRSLAESSTVLITPMPALSATLSAIFQ